MSRNQPAVLFQEYFNIHKFFIDWQNELADFGSQFGLNSKKHPL